MDLMEAQGSFETHKAEGEKLYRQGEYKKSLESFSTALVLKYDDKNCLVARSKCFLQLGEADKALIDAEAALKLEKKFTKGLYQKAEALYAMGDFEFALVFYHRGHKLRPELEEFRLGIQKAQEAIDNCVGSPEKIKLETTGDLSFFNTQEPKPKVKTQPSSPVRTSRKVSLRETSSTLRRTKKGAVAEKTVKQLLGELYSDKSYLERLLNDEDISAASACNEQIRGLVHGCLDYLESRAEFWRCQKPLYAREREKLEAKEGKGKGPETTKFILQALEDIDRVQSDGNYEESLTRARQVLTASRNWSESDVNNKHEIIGSLHNFMGVAYLELGRYDRALKDHQMDYDIAVKHGLPDSKSRALDNIGRCYAKMGQFSKAIASWQEKEGMCKSAMERTWVTHEIGRCYLELANYEKSYKYGKESYEAAVEAADEVWQLNTSVLLAQSQAKLGDLAAAASTFEHSLRHAENCDDTAATVAIGKALAEIRSRLEAKAAAVAPAASPAAAPAPAAPASSAAEESTEGGGVEEESALQEGTHEMTLVGLEQVEEEETELQEENLEQQVEQEGKDETLDELSSQVEIPLIRTEAATPYDSDVDSEAEMVIEGNETKEKEVTMKEAEGGEVESEKAKGVEEIDKLALTLEVHDLLGSLFERAAEVSQSNLQSSMQDIEIEVTDNNTLLTEEKDSSDSIGSEEVVDGQTDSSEVVSGSQYATNDDSGKELVEILEQIIPEDTGRNQLDDQQEDLQDDKPEHQRDGEIQDKESAPETTVEITAEATAEEAHKIETDANKEINGDVATFSLIRTMDRNNNGEITVEGGIADSTGDGDHDVDSDSTAPKTEASVNDEEMGKQFEEPVQKALGSKSTTDSNALIDIGLTREVSDLVIGLFREATQDNLEISADVEADTLMDAVGPVEPVDGNYTENDQNMEVETLEKLESKAAETPLKQDNSISVETSVGMGTNAEVEQFEVEHENIDSNLKEAAMEQEPVECVETNVFSDVEVLLEQTRAHHEDVASVDTEASLLQKDIEQEGTEDDIEAESVSQQEKDTIDDTDAEATPLVVNASPSLVLEATEAAAEDDSDKFNYSSDDEQESEDGEQKDESKMLTSNGDESPVVSESHVPVLPTAIGEHEMVNDDGAVEEAEEIGEKDIMEGAAEVTAMGDAPPETMGQKAHNDDTVEVDEPKDNGQGDIDVQLEKSKSDDFGVSLEQEVEPTMDELVMKDIEEQRITEIVEQQVTVIEEEVEKKSATDEEAEIVQEDEVTGEVVDELIQHDTAISRVPDESEVMENSMEEPNEEIQDENEKEENNNIETAETNESVISGVPDESEVMENSLEEPNEEIQDGHEKEKNNDDETAETNESAISRVPDESEVMENSKEEPNEEIQDENEKEENNVETTETNELAISGVPDESEVKENSMEEPNEEIQDENEKEENNDDETTESQQKPDLQTFDTNFAPRAPEGHPNKSNSRRASLLKRISLTNNKIHPA